MFVDSLGVLPEYVEALRPRRVLKPEDGFRIEQVWFPVTSPLVLPTVGQDSMSGRDSRRRIRRRVPAGDLLCDDVESDSTELGHRSGEVTVDEFLGEADGFEDLRPAVGRDRGDAHLGHHLQQALAHGLDVVADRLLHANAVEHVPVDEVFDGLQSQIRVNRRRAITYEKCHMVDFAHVTRLDQQADLAARLGSHQVMVDGGAQQQRRNRCLLGVAFPVGQDDEALALADQCIHLVEDLRESLLESDSPTGHRIQPRHARRSELRKRAVRIDVQNLRQFVVVDHRER